MEWNAFEVDGIDEEESSVRFDHVRSDQFRYLIGGAIGDESVYSRSRVFDCVHEVDRLDIRIELLLNQRQILVENLQRISEEILMTNI